MALEEVDGQVAENRAVGVPSQADEEAGDLLFLDGVDDARGDVEVVAAEFLEVHVGGGGYPGGVVQVAGGGAHGLGVVGIVEDAQGVEVVA